MAVDIVIGFDSLALVVAIGLLVTQATLVPAAGFDWYEANRIRRNSLRFLGLCLVLLWLTSLAWLWTRTAAVSGQPLDAALPVIPTVLLRTHFGSVWWLRAAALVWITVVMLFMYWRAVRPGIAATVALLFGLAWVGASRSAAGHAAAQGDWTLREGMDWLHLMSVSVWGGSLVSTLLLIFPRLNHVSPDSRARFASRFSLVATGALAVVLIAGSYNTWQMLPSVSDLWRSHYGRLLGIKLLFVAGMVACGAVNHYRLVPGLQSGSGTHKGHIARRFQASVLVESTLLVCVLSVTALLLGSQPPMT